jgi:glycosyltransferase involved in cell wall biosynthesis
MTVAGLVSTIIPVHNRPVYLRRAVDSVLAQTYRPIEILIVDDGSTDDTPLVITDLTARHPSAIRSFRQANAGPGAARERGRLHARGEFIQYLDSDDWLYPNKFADQVRALREHPDCAVAYGTTTVSDLEGKVFDAYARLTGQPVPTLFPALLNNRWWFIHTPLYRRSICDAVGPWCTMRQREDWDYDARIGSLGVSLVHSGSVVSNHSHYNSSARASQASMTDCLIFDAVFLPRLFSCALLAGVPLGSEAMTTFSRWAFFRARQLDQQGYSQESSRLLHLACLSSGGNPSSVRLYNVARMVFRPRGAAWLAERLTTLRGVRG